MVNEINHPNKKNILYKKIMKKFFKFNEKIIKKILISSKK